MGISLDIMLNYIHDRRVICKRMSTYDLLKIVYIPPISLTVVNCTKHNYNSNLEIRKLK